MTTFDFKKMERIETPKKMEQFFIDIQRICKAYNFSIAHEDGQGAFIIEKYKKCNIDWLKNAFKDY